MLTCVSFSGLKGDVFSDNNHAILKVSISGQGSLNLIVVCLL